MLERKELGSLSANEVKRKRMVTLFPSNRYIGDFALKDRSQSLDMLRFERSTNLMACF